MVYVEPKITLLGHAVAAIQAGTKDDSPSDGSDPNFNTVSAYEADE